MKTRYYAPILILFFAVWLGAQNSKFVQSVFGRSGNVTAAAGDYSFSQISGQITPAQMPSNWWLLIPPSTFCTSCANIATPGSLQTGVGFNGATIITLWDGAATAPTIRAGTGSPEGVQTAPPGSQWIRTDGGGLLYVKTGSGNTGWIQK
jgi:hypothetical protein